MANSTALTPYRAYSEYTNPGLYAPVLKTLPNDVRRIGQLVRASLLHYTTVRDGNTGTNADQKFGDMRRVPKERTNEDNDFPTAAGMLAELYRRDARGLTLNRKPEDKLVVSCRQTALLTASILKTHGIPCRVRAGFAPYFPTYLDGGKSTDHWINQYWNAREKRWASIDVDGSLSIDRTKPTYATLDAYDMPQGTFDFPADAWIAIQKGKVQEEHFENAKPQAGRIAVLWALFQDFHCLMNHEPRYPQVPQVATYEGFAAITRTQRADMDRLASLMATPDENHAALEQLFKSRADYRLLFG